MNGAAPSDPRPAGPPDTAGLIAAHHAAVYRYAYRLCGSVADAEDLTQQVFLTAHRKGGQIRDAGSARAWLFTVLRRAFFKSRRKGVPAPATTLDLQLEHVPDGWTGAWWEGSPDGAIDGERLQRALDALPDAFREVVLMFYFEHLSYREIAARLEIPAGTVMSRLSRAKSQLRQQLESAAVGAAGGRRRSEP